MKTKNLLKSLKRRFSWLLPAVMLFIALGCSTQEVRANFNSRGTYYFDNNVTNWSKVYFIIGRSDWSQAIEMSATDCDGVVSATSTWDNAYEFFFADSKCGYSDGSGSNKDIASPRSGNYSSNITSKPSKFMFVPSKASGTNISGTWSTYDNVACHLPEILSGSKIMCYGGEAKDWNQSTYYLKDTSTKADVATGSMSVEVSVGSTSYKFAPIAVAAGTYIHGHWDSGCKCAVSKGKAYIVNGENANPSGYTEKWKNGGNAVFESNSAGTITVTFTAETSITEGSNLGVTGVSAAGSSSIGKTNSIKWYISAKDADDYTEYTLTSGKLNTSGLAQGEYTLKAVLYDGNIYVVGGSKDFTITPACDTPTPVAVKINNNTSATICSGNTATISTASSQNGYKYQLINSSSAVVSTVDGKSDGSAVTFSVGTADNAYKVHAYLDGEEGCAADMSNTVKLSVDQPTVAGTITGAGDICSGETKTLSSSGATATNYKWKSCLTEDGTYEEASGTTNLSTYSAKPTVSTYYKLAVKNGECSWKYTEPVRVVVNNKPAQPGEITKGTPSPCINATGLTYSITAVATATGYTWTVPAGWSITSGAGTLSITATAGTAGGDIKVTANNDCGSSAAQTLAVTVKGKAITVSPTAVSAKKYTPTALTATTEGETVTWAVTGTNNYLLNADKTVYSNENVKQVTVKAVSGGNVTATTTNDGCETSATVTLSPTADTETCN